MKELPTIYKQCSHERATHYNNTSSALMKELPTIYKQCSHERATHYNNTSSILGNLVSHTNSILFSLTFGAINYVFPLTQIIVS